MAGSAVAGATEAADPVSAGPRAPRWRLAAAALRSPAVWLTLPVVLGLDLMVAVQRGAQWRGELSYLAEWMSPTVMLVAPFLAGLGAWLARQDTALDRGGVLRTCADGRRHVAVRVAVAAGLTAAVHLALLAALGAVSLTTARVGGWPVGTVLIQLAAFPALTSLGYLVGRVVDSLVAPVLAAGIALLLTYTDYGNARWPLGLVSDGGDGTRVGQHADVVAVLGRLSFSTAVTGLAVLAASRSFAAGRARLVRLVVLVGVGAFSVIAIQAHPQVWDSTRPLPAADRCAGTQPQICVLPDYSGRVGRAARIADRAAELLRSAGAVGLRERYLGWWPGQPPDQASVFVIDPATADQPGPALLLVTDVVAPKDCPQWRTGADLDRATAAQQIVVTWLVGQDPSLSGGARVSEAGADLNGFQRRSANQQRTRAGALATALATCRFGELPRPGSPM